MDVTYLQQPPEADYQSFVLESMREMDIPLYYGSTTGLVENGQFYTLDVKEAASTDKLSIAFQKVY